MHAEAMIFLDTETSGRYYDVRTTGIEAFSTIQELLSLCRSARYADIHARNKALFPYCPKGKLVSFHIYLYAVELNGVHGTLHVSPSQYTMFRSDDEFERLINKESSRALKMLQRRATDRHAVPQDCVTCMPRY